MRFLVDENVHAGLAAFLTAKGHDVARVPSGIKNGEVIRLAAAEGRTLLTHDKDFLDGVRYPLCPTHAIACLAVHPPTLEALKVAVERFLAADPPAAAVNATYRLRPDGFERVL